VIDDARHHPPIIEQRLSMQDRRVNQQRETREQEGPRPRHLVWFHGRHVQVLDATAPAPDSAR
jgi:hypothetical protein